MWRKLCLFKFLRCWYQGDTWIKMVHLASFPWRCKEDGKEKEVSPIRLHPPAQKSSLVTCVGSLLGAAGAGAEVRLPVLYCSLLLLLMCSLCHVPCCHCQVASLLPLHLQQNSPHWSTSYVRPWGTALVGWESAGIIQMWKHWACSLHGEYLVQIFSLNETMFADR